MDMSTNVSDMALNVGTFGLEVEGPIGRYSNAQDCTSNNSNRGDFPRLEAMIR